jgi:hypothetical protein
MKMRHWKKRMVTRDRPSMGAYLRMAIRRRTHPTAYDREADMREFFVARRDAAVRVCGETVELP